MLEKKIIEKRPKKESITDVIKTKAQTNIVSPRFLPENYCPIK